MTAAVETLALAYYFTGHEPYARDYQHRSTGSPGRRRGPLGEAAAWTAADQQRLETWFRQYLSWLRERKHGREEDRTENNHAT